MEAGGAVEQRADQAHHGVEHVLAVVQHEEHPLRCQYAGQSPYRIVRAVVGHALPDAEDAQDQLGEVPRVHRAVGGVGPGQLHQPGAVGEFGRHALGRRHRHPGLSDPARPGQGDQPPLEEEPAHLGEGVTAPDQVARGGGEIGAGPRDGDDGGRVGFAAGELRVVAEDGALKLDQGRARGQPQFLVEAAPELREAVEGLGRPVRLVEGPHLCGPQPLAEWEPADQGGQFTQQRPVLAEREPGVGVLLHDSEPLLLQAHRGGGGERLVGEVGEGGAAPEGERVGQQVRPGARYVAGPGLGDQGPEAAEVECFGRYVEEIAGWPVDDQRPGAGLRVLQGPAQLGDLRLEGGDGLCGEGGTAPEVLDQLSGGDHVTVVDEEVREEGTHLQLGDPDLPSLRCPHLQWPQNPELHNCTVTRSRRRAMAEVVQVTAI